MRSSKPMNIARPSDGLLPVGQTLLLFDLLRGRAGGTRQEQAIRDLAALTPISWSRARNTIAKLIGYGIIAVAQDTIRMAIEPTQDAAAIVADRIAGELISRLVEDRAWGCMRLDPDDGTITIDAMTLPKMSDGLGMWVTDFAVASRDRTEARYWEVAGRHRSAFLAGVRRTNETRMRRAKSAERLAAELARQVEAGEAAELWVLKFERARLRDHPLHDQIRRVSVDDVSAGYDIVSFSGSSSLQHDLFIEVKSHGLMKVFHWSRNEIMTAEEFGEEYALYLVDRTRMDDAGYAPHIISGPSPEMFAQPGSGWKVEATSFEHVAISI